MKKFFDLLLFKPIQELTSFEALQRYAYRCFVIFGIAIIGLIIMMILYYA